jgi:DNA (cytosine-5)-methyltransferase 1
MRKLKTGPWNLSDLKDIPKNGLKVFSCFHCGGGSTMGYKLSGFDVLGGVEIDPEMSKIYIKNHNPKYEYLMGVQEFKNIPDEELPKELFELDILDGSPPCSSFSMAGSREKKWSVKKKFREGQAEQVLDDLFFDFIDIAKKLKPKVVVAENVKGLIQGNARGYVKMIFKGFRDAGYDCQLFLLNAAAMGVPQKRERTFFVARRRGLGFDKIKLDFNEKPIPVERAFDGLKKTHHRPLSAYTHNLWRQAKPGETTSKYNGGKGFNNIRFPWDQSAPTVGATCGGYYHPKESRFMNDNEFARLQSFPDDFNFGSKKGQYICGMSVPPYMTNRLSNQFYKQWFKKES